MIISFCSPRAGHCANTSNMLSAAITTVFEKKLKVLVTDANTNSDDLERYIFGNSNKLNGVEVGFKPLLRLVKNNLLNAETFSDYTIPILKNSRFDFISSKVEKDLDDIEIIDYEPSHIMKIIYEAKELYDVIFVDVPYNKNSQLSDLFIKNSDLVVVNLTQNIRIIDEYIEAKFEVLNPNILVNVSNYNDYNKLNIRKIEKIIGRKGIHKTSYDAKLVDVMNGSNIVEYIGRNIMSYNHKNNTKNKNSDYLTDISKMVDKIFTENKKR